jgi:hypothetical protein
MIRRLHISALLIGACVALVSTASFAQEEPPDAPTDEGEDSPDDEADDAEAEPEAAPKEQAPAADAKASASTGAAATANVEAPEVAADENLHAGYIPGYRRAMGLGLSPYAPVTPALPGGVTTPFAAPEEEDAWTFNFTGFMSAALRVSMGSRSNPTTEQLGTTIHASPRTPDVYGGFQGTSTVPGSWVEMKFDYGTSIVTANVKLTTWKPTRPTNWTEIGSQNFVDEAYLLFRIPPIDKLRLNWTVGAFRNVYGGLGQYGVGAYNAAVIGIPWGVGETLSAQYELTDTLSVHVEHGIMGRLEKTPFGVAPQYANNASNSQKVSSWVHHAHIGLAKKGTVPIVGGLHYLSNFYADERDQIDDPKSPFLDESNRPDAKIDVFGADIRMLDNYLGNAALAVAVAKAQHAHLLTGMYFFGANSGEQMEKRYFGQMDGGTGTMVAAGIEYYLSWAKLLRYPEPFWGEGADLTTGFFASFGSVTSKDPLYDGRKLYKFGTEVTYRFLPWVAISARADHVAPNSKDAEETFTVVSPKLIFKSNWTSHEQVTLSYAKWFYGDHTHAEFPDGYAREQLDDEMLGLSFGMWW